MTWFDQYVKPALDAITAIGTLIALVALVVTVIKNRLDEDVRAQQELLEQCKRALEWAYNALMPPGQNGPPLADRLNWLTASRHILAYQELKKRITLQPQARICEDFEEFWRHRFYLALSHASLSTQHYWSVPEPIRENIDATSALVVVDFAGWPDGKEDSTSLVDVELLKQRNGLKGNAGRGLKAYIRLLTTPRASP